MSFSSWRDFWDFQREVRRERRFVRTEAAERFLAEVRRTCDVRKRRLPKASILWRAQLGHDWRYEAQIDDKIQCAHPPARMTPLVGRAREGRVNPKGIPCLYLASQEETAISEVRPWVGSYVSAAQFRTTRDLLMMDCSLEPDRVPFYFEEPDDAERDRVAWSYIDRAFSEPVSSQDDTADYVATQVLAELFRHEGCDGLVYQSSFGTKGYNIAIFELDAAEILNCQLYKIDTVKLTYRESDSRYFVQEKTVRKERKPAPRVLKRSPKKGPASRRTRRTSGGAISKTSDE